MKKYLFLVGDRNGQFFYNVKNNEFVSIYSMYEKHSLLSRIARKIAGNYVFINKFFYGNWKNLDDSFDCIICEDCALDEAIFKYLKVHFSKAEIVYWFRNSIDAVDYVKARDRNLKHAYLCDRILTFDKKNSKDYHFEYIENCYAKDPNIREVSPKYDMVFLGTDKSRYNLLMSIIHETEKMNWKNYIHIYSYTKEENEYIFHKFMDYKKYLDIVNQSKVILDVVDESYQNGYSLRIFEALFYKKKLITNHTDIKNEPFYNSNNIYIFDANDITSLNGLDKFMKKKYIEIPNDVLKKYDFLQWIRRI